MSKAEREAYAKELAKTIRDKELEYRQLSLDIQQLEINGAEGILYSTIDGTVMTASSAANAGETLLEIRGGSGAHISCILGEMDLDKYPVGTAVDGFAYQSGSSLTARIVSVGTMPITENYSNGGNSNNSGYLAVLQVDEDVSLSIGEYVEFSTATRLSDNGTVYLHAAFIREIDGQDCIFIARDGFLKKTPVLTGKRVDEYIELIGCELTTDDYIAFPYDKLAKDGAPVTIPEGNNYGW